MKYLILGSMLLFSVACSSVPKYSERMDTRCKHAKDQRWSICYTETVEVELTKSELFQNVSME